MDMISQAALGAAIGEAGFREKLGPKAVYVGALAAFAVDADIFAGLGGDWAMLTHHRAVTHSLFVLAALAPLVGWLGWRWTGREPKDRTGTWRQWSFLAAWAMLTHPILDYFTSWGTQLLWPFSDHRFAADGIFIVDAFYTLPLIAAFVLAVVKRVPRDLSKRFASGALALTTLYVLTGAGLSLRAESAAARQLERDGVELVEVRAVPTFMNLVVWRVVGRDADGTIYTGAVSAVSPGEIDFHRLDMPRDPLVAKALASDRGRTYAWFAKDFVQARVERGEDGTARVLLGECGVGIVSDPVFSPFPAVARFGARGELLEVELLGHDPRMDVGAELTMLWRIMWGG